MESECKWIVADEYSAALYDNAKSTRQMFHCGYMIFRLDGLIYERVTNINEIVDDE